jgi:hypothetical protein
MMNRPFAKIFLLVMICLAGRADAQVNSNTLNGFALIKRPENSGIINVRPSFIQIDRAAIEVVLIGGEQTTLALSPGKHTVLVHSMDPYDPQSSDYTWVSTRDTIDIIAAKLTTLKIQPQAKNTAYCCGWSIIK